jgi:membrane-associated phospholipid phosphatase
VSFALHRLQLVDDAAMSRMPPAARKGSTWFGSMGDITQQPPFWVALAALLSAAGGERGRRAAWRGTACYGATAVVANMVIKPMVRRSRPPGAGENRTGPVTSSFPSGHAATDLAFVLGVAQEIPVLFPVLSLATLSAHWSLVRSRGHYPTDVLAGGALGVGVAAVAWVVWPPPGSRRGRRPDDVGGDDPGADEALSRRDGERR